MAVTAPDRVHWLCHTRGARAAIIVAILTIVLIGLSPGIACAIPGDAALARGMAWINAGVPYSQRRNYGGYRTDCSGFVSMCWGAKTSYSTSTLHHVAHPITVAELQPGDALLKPGNHVRLFAGWVDSAHTSYIAYEQTTPGAVQTVKYIASDLAYGYRPYRYNQITSSPSSWNLLANPTFDVWSGTTPVWWTASKDASGPVSSPQRAGALTPRYSLGISNRSKNGDTMAEVRQTVAIEANRTYTLSLSAWTDREPRALQIRLQFLDAGGRAVVDTWTAGDAAGLRSAGFTPVTISCVAPSTATSATVSLRLAGGAYVSTDTAGSALIDDVSFQVSSPMPVYRFFNPRKGAHFYTASGPERDSVVRTLWKSYTYEGVAYSVPISPANSQNLYRFYNKRTGTHFYTASEAERADVARRLGATYRFEGVAYKVSPSAVAGSLAVYRFYRPRSGTHFYTASVFERDVVARTLRTYHYEGPAFYVAP